MNNLYRKMGMFFFMMVGFGFIIGLGWLFGVWRVV